MRHGDRDGCCCRVSLRRLRSAQTPVKTDRARSVRRPARHHASALQGRCCSVVRLGHITSSWFANAIFTQLSQPVLSLTRLFLTDQLGAFILLFALVATDRITGYDPRRRAAYAVTVVITARIYVPLVTLIGQRSELVWNRVREKNARTRMPPSARSNRGCRRCRSASSRSSCSTHWLGCESCIAPTPLSALHGSDATFVLRPTEGNASEAVLEIRYDSGGALLEEAA